MRRVILAAAALLLSTQAALALPLKWTVQNAVFDDGGTVSGSFIYDPDVGIFGTYSQIKVQTSGGALPERLYTFTTPNADSSFAAFTDMMPTIPDDFTGLPELFLRLDDDLTNAGGEVFFNLTNFTFPSGEYTCDIPDCGTGPLERPLISGSVVATPIPLPAGGILLLGALGAFAAVRGASDKSSKVV